MTFGCIRIPSNAMTTINATHETEPLTYLYVEDDLVTRMAESEKAKRAI